MLVVTASTGTFIFSDGVGLAEPDSRAYTIHGVIYIEGNTDFYNTAQNEGWAGDGTQANPYVIENYEINATGSDCGIYIGNVTYYFTIRSNYITNATKHDILIFNSTNFNIVYNKLYKDGYYNGDGTGLYIDNSYWTATGTQSVAYIANNSFKYAACVVKELVNSTLENNTGYRAADPYDFAAISVARSTNVYMENNSMKTDSSYGGEHGIYVRDSVNVTVYYNYVVSYANGITLHGSTQKTNVIYNNVTEASKTGIYINTYGLTDYDNHVYFNNIINSTGAFGSAYTIYGGNTTWWNDTAGHGNYWSDYTTLYPSANVTGDVWDTPYRIDCYVDSNKSEYDYYPLVNITKITHTPDFLDPEAKVDSEIISHDNVATVLNGSASWDDTGIVNYTWSFTYNGTPVSLYGEVVNYTFEIPGVYYASLRVEDGYGKYDVKDFVIAVRPAGPECKPFSVNSDYEKNLLFPGGSIINLTVRGTGFSTGLYIGNITGTFLIHNVTVVGVGSTALVFQNASGINADALNLSSPGDGIAIQTSSGVDIQNSTVYAGSTGVYVDGTNIGIRYSTLNASYGVSISPSAQQVYVEYNTVDAKFYGILMSSSPSGEVYINHNTITQIPGNSGTGMALKDDGSYRVTVHGNDIISFYDGVSIYSYSSNISFDNNTVSGSGRYGIYIALGCTNNFFLYNTIEDAVSYGMYIESSNNNTRDNAIHHNAFLNNNGGGVQVYSQTAKYYQYFDDGAEGNYWSDYTSRYPSATNDGNVWSQGYVVDYPYSSTDAGVDRYPLVRMYHKPFRIDSQSELNAQFSDGNVKDMTINGTGYGYSIYIGNCSGFNITTLFLKGASGVNSGPYYSDANLILYNCSDVYIGNVETDGGSYGIYIVGSTNIRIAGANVHSIADSGAGIYLESTSSVWLNDSTINGYHNSLTGTSASGLSVNSTSFQSPYSTAVVLGGGTGVDIKNSMVDHAGLYGVYIDGASSVNILSCKITYSTSYGVYINTGTSILIYSNQFKYNNLGGVQAYDDAGAAWDNGSWGNFWSDYDSRYPSATNDGNVWDTPYAINGTAGAQDNYPIAYLLSDKILINGDADFAVQFPDYVISYLKIVINDENDRGIDIQNVNVHFRIEHCYILSEASGLYYTKGVYLESTANGTVNDVIVKNTAYGLYLYYADYNTIENCNITATRYGMEIYYSDHNVVLSSWINVTQQNQYGMEVSYSTGNELSNNRILVPSSSSGIYMNAAPYTTLYSNEFTNGGITLYGSSEADFDTHTIPANNTVNAVPIRYYASQTGGLVNLPAGQVILAYCNYVNITGISLVQPVRYAIPVYYGGSNHIYGVNVSYAQNGVLLHYSTENRIDNSTFYRNGDGIRLYYSSYSQILNNEIKWSTTRGIDIDGEDYGVIRYNNISNSAGYGIMIGYGTSIRIDHNNFVDNNLVSNEGGYNKQAADYSGGNYWDDGAKGNYWSDWTSPDSDNNGIVDNPYVIDSWVFPQPQDNYPLVNPVADAGVLPEFSGLLPLGAALLLFLFAVRRKR